MENKYSAGCSRPSSPRSRELDEEPSTSGDGIARELFETSRRLLVSIIRDSHNRNSIPPELLRQYRKEVERLVLWIDGFEGELDEVIDYSPPLKNHVLCLLAKIGRIVTRDLFLLLKPQASDRKLHQEFYDVQRVLEKTKLVMTELKTETADRIMCSDSDQEVDYLEVLDDLASVIDCLMDLTPALENPAKETDMGGQRESGAYKAERKSNRGIIKVGSRLSKAESQLPESSRPMEELDTSQPQGPPIPYSLIPKKDSAITRFSTSQKFSGNELKMQEQDLIQGTNKGSKATIQLERIVQDAGAGPSADKEREIGSSAFKPKKKSGERDADSLKNSISEAYRLLNQGQTLIPVSNTSKYPSNLSFLVRVETINPNYNVQKIRCDEDLGFWVPPDRRDAYHSQIGGTLFRSKGGKIKLVKEDDPIHHAILETYQTASLFMHHDTGHLLAVDFDARDEDVNRFGRGWKTLFFSGKISQDAKGLYSYVQTYGSNRRINAPAAKHWVPQLLPSVYNFHSDFDSDSNSSMMPEECLGLIGDLPILLALAAFSARPEYLASVLEGSVQPGKWINHDFPSGHIKEGGMVVTIYLDPKNHPESTLEILSRLEQGAFGPFYGP